MSEGQAPPPAAPAATAAAGWAPAGVPAGMRGWMTFVAVMTILSGVLSVLSCVGIITGVLMLVAGISLLGARSALDGIHATDPATWQFLAKLKTFLVATGWTYILGLIVAALVFMLWGGAIIAAALAAAGQR
ncbi:MAG: hypothetical protein D6738_13125 [Acidobacteria bacterium]|nr:MAG: hypothetical protein D6738_13125 [Acidobacteriota bacterium]